jgi:hypothetical protein
MFVFVEKYISRRKASDPAPPVAGN